MLIPYYSKQFEKDLKRMLSRGKSGTKIKYVIRKLINEERLERCYGEHKLIGNYKSMHECHIEPDWLLIYKIFQDEIIFQRTGTHADLFE